MTASRDGSPRDRTETCPRWHAMAIVGRIARAHGNRGQVIVNVETDFPELRFRPGAELFINRGTGGAEQIDALMLTTVRFHRDRPVVGFAGIDGMDSAEALAGLELRVPADRLAALPEGSFYHHELAGCQVETRSGERIGLVTAVEGTTDGSRLVVDGPRGEILIPLAAAICTTIDPKRKRIVVDPPAGLLELNEK